MPRKSKSMPVAVEYQPPKRYKEEDCEMYKKDYEFGDDYKYAYTGRMNLSKWEMEDAKHEWSYMSQTERDMINKKPSSYRGETKQGKYRLSGAKGAHRIGGRKGK